VLFGVMSGSAGEEGHDSSRDFNVVQALAGRCSATKGSECMFAWSMHLQQGFHERPDFASRLCDNPTLCNVHTSYASHLTYKDVGQRRKLASACVWQEAKDSDPFEEACKD
jgi:hypothetical protein